MNLSLLDLALVGQGEQPSDALHGSVTLARAAESVGYKRVWYAEHHNMSMIASSAPAVLIAHVAANTSTIRLGAGGVMLPNHAPLTIAEQFGTLATLHPDRIDVGLGRAPGTDGVTLRALRRGPDAAESFPQDVLELQGYLSGDSRVPGVAATPGAGTKVPLYILGSSLFGARLAAQLGLPYGFASHFAPEHLTEAVALYRREFRPSVQCDRPYVIAGINVLAADTEAEARAHLLVVRRTRARLLLARGAPLSDAQADQLLASPHGAFVETMMRFTVLGPPAQVRDGLTRVARFADADELMLVHTAPSLAARVRSLALTPAA